jgi:hypothetical protein
VSTANNSQWQCAAILVEHGADLTCDTNAIKIVLIPHGQIIELDRNAQRPFLWPHLGDDWHLHAFVPVEILGKP